MQIHVVSAADTFLPLIVADAMRPDLTPEEEEKAEKEGKVSTPRALIPPRCTFYFSVWAASSVFRRFSHIAPCG